METALWILVVILSVTLFAFLLAGIILIVNLIGLSKEAKEVIIEGQDIAKNTNGIVSNVKGMTSIGGAMEMFVNDYVTPKIKEKAKGVKAAKEAKQTTEKKTSNKK